jgi:hypothetical protein
MCPERTCDVWLPGLDSNQRHSINSGWALSRIKSGLLAQGVGRPTAVAYAFALRLWLAS